jgi:hypothetical protein
MKAKRSPYRRNFANRWDEIRHLYQKLLYWLYQRGDAGKARPYAERLARLLAEADPGHEAIFGEECRSLVCEAKGDLAKAIKHRENEIRLIRRLHEISRGKPYEEFALEGYGSADLSDRLDLLATLYHDSGDLDRAISTLRESKRYCQGHGIRFDGEDILREYLEERGGVMTGVELLTEAGNASVSAVELLIEVSNGSVSSKTLPPGTLAKTREVVKDPAKVVYSPQPSRKRYEVAC